VPLISAASRTLKTLILAVQRHFSRIKTPTQQRSF
jgi:hypothetical protein